MGLRRRPEDAHADHRRPVSLSCLDARGAPDNGQGIAERNGDRHAHRGRRSARRGGGGEGPAKELLPIRGQQFPSDWTRDGRTLFYEQWSRETSWDIWTVGGAARTATPVVATRFPE